MSIALMDGFYFLYPNKNILLNNLDKYLYLFAFGDPFFS